MNKRNGYLCEYCREREARYETRFVMEGKNILICEQCFKHVDLSHDAPVLHKKAEWDWKTAKRA